MWTSTNKKLSLFISIIFIIGLIIGIIFFICLDEASKELILLNINDWLQNIEQYHINALVSHILILSFLLVSSFIFVGVPFILFFIFYNGFSFGFMIVSLISIFGIRGLLYGLIYGVVTKLVYLIFFGIFTITMLKIVKIILGRLFLSKAINRDSFILFLKRIFICIVIIFIYDIILYFGGAKLISIFNFLLN